MLGSSVSPKMQRAAVALAGLAVLQRLRGRSIRPVLAAATFVGVFRLARRIVRRAQDDSAQRSVVLESAPGFAAAIGALAIEESFASALWVIWLWVRVARFALPPVPHAEVLTGSLAAGINLSTYLWDHRRLAPAYTRFLASCGGSNNKGLGMIEQIRLKPDTDRLHRFCHIIHPGESCNRFAVDTLLQGAAFGAKIQIPLHILTHAIKYKTSTLSGTLFSLLRAVLFLGAYPAAAMAIICNWWKLTGERQTKTHSLPLTNQVGRARRS